MTTAPAPEAPKDKDRDATPAADALVTERGKRFEEDQDATARTGDRPGRHEGSDAKADAEAEDDPFALDDEAKARRLSNTHHGHVLTALRRLHAGTEDGGTVSRDDLWEVLEMMEAAHSQPVPQPESGSTVHGTTGPGAPPDIHHTPFSTIERHRQPGQ